MVVGASFVLLISTSFALVTTLVSGVDVVDELVDLELPLELVSAALVSVVGILEVGSEVVVVNFIELDGDAIVDGCGNSGNEQFPRLPNLSISASSGEAGKLSGLKSKSGNGGNSEIFTGIFRSITGFGHVPLAIDENIHILLELKGSFSLISSHVHAPKSRGI